MRAAGPNNRGGGKPRKTTFREVRTRPGVFLIFSGASIRFNQLFKIVAGVSEGHRPPSDGPTSTAYKNTQPKGWRIHPSPNAGPLCIPPYVGSLRIPPYVGSLRIPPYVGLLRIPPYVGLLRIPPYVGSLYCAKPNMICIALDQLLYLGARLLK